jgi:hypothetical protein
VPRPSPQNPDLAYLVVESIRALNPDEDKEREEKDAEKTATATASLPDDPATASPPDDPVTASLPDDPATPSVAIDDEGTSRPGPTPVASPPAPLD